MFENCIFAYLVNVCRLYLFAACADFSGHFLDVRLFLRCGVPLRTLHGAGDKGQVPRRDRAALQREEREGKRQFTNDTN